MRSKNLPLKAISLVSISPGLSHVHVELGFHLSQMRPLDSAVAVNCPTEQSPKQHQYISVLLTKTCRLNP